MANTIKLSSEEETDTIRLTDTVNTISGFDWNGFSEPDYATTPTITSIDLPSITLSNTTGTGYTIGSGMGLGHSNVMWTTTTSPYQTTISNGTSSPGMNVNQGGKLSLQGDNADIDINGKSLVQWMRAMEERMNWMQPNVEMEKEWDDLKKLGDRYRKLEQKCKEKAEMWKKLKSMPKPEIK